jgi:hypothetical protein
MLTTKLIAMTVVVLTVGLVTTGAEFLANPGQPPGAKSKSGPNDADGRSPDDQVAELLRQYDETVKSNLKTANGQVGDDEKVAEIIWANKGKIDEARTRMLTLATRHPRTNAAEQALIWLVSSRLFGPESNKGYRPDWGRPNSRVINRHLEANGLNSSEFDGSPGMSHSFQKASSVKSYSDNRG